MTQKTITPPPSKLAEDELAWTASVSSTTPEIQKSATGYVDIPQNVYQHYDIDDQPIIVTRQESGNAIAYAWCEPVFRITSTSTVHRLVYYTCNPNMYITQQDNKNDLAGETFSVKVSLFAKPL